jgi:hypothetical protein
MKINENQCEERNNVAAIGGNQWRNRKQPEKKLARRRWREDSDGNFSSGGK